MIESAVIELIGRHFFLALLVGSSLCWTLNDRSSVFRSNLHLVHCLLPSPLMTASSKSRKILHRMSHSFVGCWRANLCTKCKPCVHFIFGSPCPGVLSYITSIVLPTLTYYMHHRMHVYGDSHFLWPSVFWRMPSSGLLVIQRKRTKAHISTKVVGSYILNAKIVDAEPARSATLVRLFVL